MKTVNLALQVLPQAQGVNSYNLVDKAIEVIQKSGLKYKVCPFETVIEGTFDQVMEVVKKVHQSLEAADVETLMTYIKIQTNFHADVTIEDKMEKY
ncbi:MAG: MTH1187 family thiamine-binding protein [Mangrovibacterium sp.]